MKKIALFIFLAVGSLTLLSCSETEETVNEFDNWQARNDEYFTEIYRKAKANPDRYRIIRNWSFEDSVNIKPEYNIVVEVLNQGTGSGSPMYTDSVSVHYQGMLIPTDTYKDGFAFEQTWTDGYDLSTNKPVGLKVSNVVDGFTTALMNMHIGDRWRVYMPYSLAYGSSAAANGKIPAYSALIFDITLAAYYRPDYSPSTSNARPHKSAWVTE